jgi:Dyp-type peroxidase family
MAQAKGILPTRGDDREVLYKNPRMNGYFIGVRLAPASEPDQLQHWIAQAGAAIDALVEREPVQRPAGAGGLEKGEKLASAAVGLAPSFFDRLEQAGHTLERPVGFVHVPARGWLPGVATQSFDVLFYVAAVAEARVNDFVAALASPLVLAVGLERGYQRPDETEPFGYRDGVRNVAKSRRSEVVFVHTEGDQPDEPAWADGGTYMVTMKIQQRPDAFKSLGDDGARDAVIGRRKDGTRLDLPAGTDPHDETDDVPNGLPPASHVRKAGPRGTHDDTEIFRRGLPYLEVTGDQVQVGLHFCSFQANPAQFDTMFSDWMMNTRFPATDAGTDAGSDALLAGNSPAGPLVTILHGGLYFVPPHKTGGLLAAITQPATRGKPTTGRLAIRKTVVDPSNPNLRLERGGFVFQVHHDGAPVPGAEFTTTSSGRGVCPVDLVIGQAYTLVEMSSPHQTATLTNTDFTMAKSNEHLEVTNNLAQPATGYLN